MNKLFQIGLAILVLGVTLFAVPTLDQYTQGDIFVTQDNAWWDGQEPLAIEWEHLPLKTPYSSGQPLYDGTLDHSITESALEIVVEEVDFGTSSQILLQDKTGVWYPEKYIDDTIFIKETQFSDRLDFEEGLSYGSGSVSGGHGSNPRWGDGTAINTGPNLPPPGGWKRDGKKPPSDVFDDTPVAPAPGAMVLSGVGIVIIAWLHHRRSL